MWDILFITILSVFAVYGVISLINENIGLWKVYEDDESSKTVMEINKANNSHKSSEEKAVLMLAVKDNENNVEAIVRNIYNSGITNISAISKGLVVIDCGSSDRTLFILNGLSKEYCDMKMLSELVWLP